jgi:hypothetical protein
LHQMEMERNRWRLWWIKQKQGLLEFALLPWTGAKLHMPCKLRSLKNLSIFYRLRLWPKKRVISS